MNPIIAIIAAAIATSGQSCAVISNTTNSAAWARPGHGIVLTTYADRGTYLRYRKPLPRGHTRRALRLAEEYLQLGVPGPQLTVSCA